MEKGHTAIGLMTDHPAQVCHLVIELIQGEAFNFKSIGRVKEILILEGSQAGRHDTNNIFDL
jgi:hypothetical protein